MAVKSSRLRRGFLLAILVLAIGALAASLTARIHGRRHLAEARARLERAIGPQEPRTARELPETENAAVWFQAGAQAIVGTREEKKDRLAGGDPHEWSEDQTAKAVALVERNRPAFELLARGAALDRSSYDIRWRGGRASDPDLPDLVKLAHAGNLLATRASLHVLRGEIGEAVGTVETLARLSRSLEDEPTPLTLLVGTAMERLQVKETHLLLEQAPLDEELLHRLRASLPEGDIVRMYGRAYAMDMTPALIDAVHEGDGLSILSRLRLFFAPELVEAEAIEHAIALSEALGSPYVLVQDKLARNVPDVFIGIPNLINSTGRMSGTALERMLARLALDLRLAALGAGAYPASLDAYPDAAATDPLTGSALRYERRADGSALLAAPRAAEVWATIVPQDVGAFEWSLPRPESSARTFIGATRPSSAPGAA